jgi:hypothetical protein
VPREDSDQALALADLADLFGDGLGDIDQLNGFLRCQAEPPQRGGRARRSQGAERYDRGTPPAPALMSRLASIRVPLVSSMRPEPENIQHGASIEDDGRRAQPRLGFVSGSFWVRLSSASACVQQSLL